MSQQFHRPDDGGQVAAQLPIGVADLVGGDLLETAGQDVAGHPPGVRVAVEPDLAKLEGRGATTRRMKLAAMATVSGASVAGSPLPSASRTQWNTSAIRASRPRHFDTVSRSGAGSVGSGTMRLISRNRRTRSACASAPALTSR